MEEPDERDEVTAQVWNAIRAALGQRSICLIAPYFDRFFVPVLKQLSVAGAEVRCVIAANSDPQTRAAVRLPLMDFSKHINALPDTRFEFILEKPPASLCRWLDAIDPHRDMHLLGSAFTGVSHVCERPVFAWRRAEWADWEDKTQVDAKFDSLGIAHPAHTIGSSDDPELCGSFEQLNAGLGVVIAAGSGHGERGGGSSLSVARTQQDFDHILSDLREKPCTLRISQFIAGIPSSVIGMASNGCVFLFDPIEIVTLFDCTTSRFVFCGSSTYWRPSARIAEQMQSAAASVGRALMQDAGFKGAFSVDGIVADGRFLATEVNARHASGLGLSRIWPDFPMYLFSRCLVEGGPAIELIDIDYFVRKAREAIRSAPSLSVLVPRSRDRVLEDEIALPLTAGSIRVHCRPSPNGRRARIVSLDRIPDSTLVTPLAAALAARLGRPELVNSSI